MKYVVQVATSIPFAVALAVVFISVTAILTQYPGSINIDWGQHGGSFNIDGSPLTK